jgi:arsenite methyltransferase
MPVTDLPVSASTPSSRRGRYGIDAPGVVRMFLIGGGAAALVAAIGLTAGSPSTITSAAVGIALVALVEGGWMLYTSKVAKLRERTRIIDRAELRESDAVLDVGCGRGLLLTEAARRVPQGLAVGIDLWSEEDQSGNRPEETAENAIREGVADRVEIKTGDARELPFGADFFDAVVSTMTLHNIRESRGREQAVREMVRVLRPGGRIVIVDMGKTDEYAATLSAAGLLGVERGPRVWRMFPPVRYVTAAKP